MASETSGARESLSKYCQGYGIDVGFGGDPIIPSAITVDLPKPYTQVGHLANYAGQSPQNLGGDCKNLYWFKDGVLDYVYSSHLLEDFLEPEVKQILKEWFRVLKSGGKFILYCPVERVYREHCRVTGQDYNLAHKLLEFDIEFVKKLMNEIGLSYVVIHENPLVNTYSFELVAVKI